MNIFTKLAYDHIIDVKGDSPMVPGDNNLRPAEPSAEGVTLKDDHTNGHLTDTVLAGHKETMHGELSRAFDNYAPSVREWNKVIGDHLEAKITEISGSSAASQARMRHGG